MIDSVRSIDQGMKTGVYLHIKTISRLKIHTLSMNIYVVTFKNILYAALQIIWVK